MSLHIPDHADFNFPAEGEFYIEFDYKPGEGNKTDGIFRKLNSFTLRRVFSPEDGFQFQLDTIMPDHEKQVYVSSVIPGTKYRLKVVYDNSRYEFYIDNVKQVPEEYYDNPILESEDGFIFGFSSGVGTFRVKDIKIYRINT